VVTALYRRYRPETFAELIGQSQVTDPLRTALRNDRVNHAYLFSGPRGCGKTTSARILARVPGDRWEVVQFTLPPELSRYVVEKGSITVDGVSLTVSDVTDDTFSVSLIPTTLGLTTLGHKVVGDAVNLEVDVIAKYVERLLTHPGAGAEPTA